MKRNFIISHNRNLAFVHVSKAGSSSIAKMILEEEYGVTHLHDREMWKYCKYEVQNKIFSQDPIDGYEAYCFVRNPYSRVYASFRQFMDNWQRRKYQLKGFVEFNVFVKNRLHELFLDRHFISMKYFVDIAGTWAKVVRFEEFAEVMKAIWGSEICHENHKPFIDYRQEYNDESKEIVSKMYAWDIENLEYDF